MNPTNDPLHPGSMPTADSADGSDPSHASQGPDNAQRADALESAFDEMRERWMRSEAEIANVRTRARRDVDDARQFAVQKFATDVVEAAENLHRGLEGLPAACAQEPESVTGLRRGLLEIERGFIGVLERNGVKRDDPMGLAFDPNLHQAISEQEGAAIKPGTILKTLAPTWTLNGRLLRPAMVIVAKAASASPPAASRHSAR